MITISQRYSIAKGQYSDLKETGMLSIAEKKCGHWGNFYVTLHGLPTPQQQLGKELMNR
jgi:hypothetical protein